MGLQIGTAHLPPLRGQILYVPHGKVGRSSYCLLQLPLTSLIGGDARGWKLGMGHYYGKKDGKYPINDSIQVGIAEFLPLSYSVGARCFLRWEMHVVEIL